MKLPESVPVSLQFAGSPWPVCPVFLVAGHLQMCLLAHQDSTTPNTHKDTSVSLLFKTFTHQCWQVHYQQNIPAGLIG